MSCGCALGETSSWWQLTAGSSEVFVWRCQFTGANIATVDDALAIVHGAAQAPTNPLDVRGIAVKPSGGGFSVDIVWTIRMWMTNPDRTGLLYHWPTAKDVATAIAADPGVRGRFPQLAMSGYEWLELEGPADALDFWRAHSILWDRALGDGKIGAPTQAFADRDGAYVGAADEGQQLRRLPGSGKKDIGPPGTDQPASKTALWVALGAGVILAAWYFGQREQKR